MLTLSPAAASAVTTVTSQGTDSPDAGLRIGADVEQFAVSVAQAPKADEIVVEQDGARDFMPEPVAEVLDHMSLDAQVTAGGQVSFGIARQA